MAQVECKNLSVGYDGDIVAGDINFTVNKGDYLCILGENGSGKSTLMKTVLHLIPPASGMIVMGDGLKDTDIGYLPQQTVTQKDFPASVEEIVLSGCQGKRGLRPFYNAKEKKIAVENMKRLGIEGLAKKNYRHLSGGQQQRVLLARALCATQKVLLLDEPVAGLDPKVTSDMYQLIKNLNDAGISIIMISHDTDAAIEYATHVLHIRKKNKKHFFGTKDEYIKTELGKKFLDL